MHLGEAILCPVLEATDVNTLDSAFTPTRCNERVIKFRTLSQANTASLGLAVADRCTLGSKTGIPRFYLSNCCGICDQLTDTEFGTPDFDKITLRKCVESHGEAPYSKPPLLWLWIGRGRPIVTIRRTDSRPHVRVQPGHSRIPAVVNNDVRLQARDRKSNV